MLIKIGLLLLGLSLLVGKLSRTGMVKRVTKGREQQFSLGLTGAEFARRLMEAKDIQGVEVVESNAILTNFYDPATRQLRLSPENYHSRDLTAVAYAAHETGHAIQHAADHHPLYWRITAIKATVFTSMAVLLISIPLVLIPPFGRVSLFVLGVGWAMIRLHNIMTVPVEIDASSRVKDLILNAKILRRSNELDQLEEIFQAVALEKVSGFGAAWAWLSVRIFPWRRREAGLS